MSRHQVCATNLMTTHLPYSWYARRLASEMAEQEIFKFDAVLQHLLQYKQRHKRFTRLAVMKMLMLS